MMYRHTLEAATESIHELELLLRGFPADGKIPEIEVDLVLQKLRNLYELILMIKDIREIIPESEKQTETATEIISSKKNTKEEADFIQIEKKTESIMAEKKEVRPSETNSVSIDTEKPAKSPVEKITIREAEAKTVPVETSAKKSSEKEIKTLADQFKGKKILHEVLHTTQKETDIYAQAKPVSDLMAAIGINDRFTFIRELFNNDSEIFEQTISILNDSASFNDAYNFMARNFDWDMDSHPVQLLLDIIRRKFIKGRHE